ncbi:hypothetical protein HD554DRAFT_1044175 [Boletus coccyginus]|nr:hypothetical protein HD554DRAFT_1044175 [Boletus coccyginus]
MFSFLSVLVISFSFVLGFFIISSFCLVQLQVSITVSSLDSVSIYFSVMCLLFSVFIFSFLVMRQKRKEKKKSENCNNAKKEFSFQSSLSSSFGFGFFSKTS